MLLFEALVRPLSQAYQAPESPQAHQAPESPQALDLVEPETPQLVHRPSVAMAPPAHLQSLEAAACLAHLAANLAFQTPCYFSCLA